MSKFIVSCDKTIIMKKIKLLLFFILLSLPSFGQRDFTKVDQFARAYHAKTKDYKVLAQDLTTPFDNKTDKARAIYVWITDNIKYDCKKFHKRAKGKAKKEPIQFRTEAEKAQKIAQRMEAYAATTLKKKKGVCEDYALLFQKMCGAIGIESEFVTGHLGGRPENLGKIPQIFNHAWNSIKLDGKWYLVDATLGSGTVEGNCKKFHKKFNSGLFMTQPKDMLLTHFPDKPEWQYLEQPLDKKAFSQLPIAGAGFYQVSVIDYFPKEGIISAKETKTVLFKVKFAKKGPKMLRLTVNGKQQPGDFELDKDGYWIYEYPLKKRRKKTMSILIKDQQGIYQVLSYKSK